MELLRIGAGLLNVSLCEPAKVSLLEPWLELEDLAESTVI